MLARLVRRGLVARRIPGQDGRRRHLRLTRKGRKAFATLDTRATRQVASLLRPLAAPERHRLVGAMQAIERLLAPPEAAGPPFQLRSHRPGDLGWVVERHGALYFEEYGWDVRFEGLVAGIMAEFVRDYDADRDRCWIAERDGQRLGCVFLVREPGSPGTARLRCLLVDPAARGQGLGERLIAECVGFARQAGYQRIVLWTNDVLHAARRLYERAGFVLIRAEAHARFGHGLVGETWELTLTR
jgi:GNAT superfamily N-acetyltransferase